MTASTIVIIEDNDAGRKLERDLLQHSGFRTYEASNGTDGVRLVRRHRPAAVILDLWLPDRTGLQILAELRADPATRGIPVIAVTALAMETDRQRIAAAGFDAYLSKPIRVLEFIDTVRRIIEHDPGKAPPPREPGTCE
jgi:two-component system cell cycle response regulator DivK